MIISDLPLSAFSSTLHYIKKAGAEKKEVRGNVTLLLPQHRMWP